MFIMFVPRMIVLLVVLLVAETVLEEILKIYAAFGADAFLKKNITKTSEFSVC